MGYPRGDCCFILFLYTLNIYTYSMHIFLRKSFA